MPATVLPDFLTDLGHGVFAVDTGFQRARFDAAYLLLHGGRAAFIDTGTALAVPRLLAALDATGTPRSAVDWIIPTHVHLDHAGGVGTLAAELPQARVLVHQRGLRHVVDPSAVWQGATEVYGPEEMARSYGRVLPVDAARVQATSDGMRLSLGGRELLFIDSPGHARHHHCIWDATSRGWFAGDTFGVGYPELANERGRWMLPASTPVQFEPDALRVSVQRLLDAAPECIYVTHFGRIDDVQRHAAQMLAVLDRTVQAAESLRHAPERHAALCSALTELYVEGLAAHGVADPRGAVAALLAMDVELNASGIAFWLDR